MNPRQVVTGEAQGSGVHLRWKKQERVQGGGGRPTPEECGPSQQEEDPPRQHRECLLYSV